MPGTNTAIADDELGSGIVTTTNGQVDTVTFDRDVDTVEILNYDGANWLWITVDGSAPTVGGKTALPIPPAAGESLVLSPPGGGVTTVKLIAATATKYVVTESLS